MPAELKEQTVLEQISSRSTYQASELKKLVSIVYEKVNRISDGRVPTQKASGCETLDPSVSSDFAQSMNISMNTIDESMNTLGWIVGHLNSVV